MNGEVKPTRALPHMSAVLTGLVLILITYLFFSGATLRFYASAVFLFYALFKQMWIAVVCLGVFQTFLMIPIRVVNLLNAKSVDEFREKVENVENLEEQRFLIKHRVKTGSVNLLLYLVNFFIQTISYLTIGRLFLTDFYNKKLESWILYNFVPYPNYPIQGRFYHIPYPIFSKTIDLGFKVVLLVWLGILIYKLAADRLRKIYRKMTSSREDITENSWIAKTIKGVVKSTSGSLSIMFVISYFLVRHFPKQLAWRIFSGDVGIPNPRFNLVTAIVTTITIIWLGIPKISKKIELARAMKVPEEIIRKTQTDMFTSTLRSAIVLGLGAYFITNQIPSAFELSIFTFEIISWISPFTLDKVILSSKTG